MLLFMEVFLCLSYHLWVIMCTARGFHSNHSTSQHTNSISATMQESVWYQMLSLLNTPPEYMLLSHSNNLPALPLFMVLRRKQHY